MSSYGQSKSVNKRLAAQTGDKDRLMTHVEIAIDSLLSGEVSGRLDVTRTTSLVKLHDGSRVRITLEREKLGEVSL